MDYSGFRRSENVEGEPRKGEFEALMNFLVGQPMDAFKQLTEHPFTTVNEHYWKLHDLSNPVPRPDQYTSLAKEGGIEDVGRPRPQPDSEMIQRLLEQLGGRNAER